MTITRRQFTVGLALFVAAVAITCITFGLTARAHDPNVNPSCAGLAVNFTQYEGPESNNQLTVTIDGKATVVEFAGGFQHTYPWSPTSAHTWTVVVDANRLSGDATAYDFQQEGTQQRCQTTTSRPPASTTSTTVPATSSSSPATTAPATTNPSTPPTTIAPSTVPSTTGTPATVTPTSAASTTSSSPATSAPYSTATRSSQPPASTEAGCTGSTCELPATGNGLTDTEAAIAVTLLLLGALLLWARRLGRKGARS